MRELAVVAAYGVFLLSYLVFAMGKFPWMNIDRPGAAIIGAVLMVAFGVVSPAEALRVVDFRTIVLLFSMMLLVAYLHQAGFFDRVIDGMVTTLRPHHLLPTVIFLSGLLSAFFVNDIICLVMAPFALTAARRMGLRPLPYLLAVATASNIGSVASITGNPQNMLIGSYSGIRYAVFLAYLGPIALVGLFLDWAVVWLVAVRRAGPYPAAEGTVQEAVPSMEPPAASAISLRGRSGLVKPGAVAALVLVGFLAGFPPALVAALGAAAVLISRTREPRKIYDEVDWGLLVFFVGLFVIVRGAENAGLMEMLLAWTHGWNLEDAGVFTLATAVLSNIVSNVPAVMLLKSIVPHFANPRTGWLLLATASTLGGNLTITGSIANIIVIERAKATVKISFGDYFRIGLPITAATMAFGWFWLSLVR